MHPIMNAWLAEIHQEEIQQTVTRHRAQAAAQSCRTGLRERLSVRLGTLLIAAGQRIRAPYEPLLDRRPGTYGPGC